MLAEENICAIIVGRLDPVLEPISFTGQAPSQSFLCFVALFPTTRSASHESVHSRLKLVQSVATLQKDVSIIVQ